MGIRRWVRVEVDCHIESVLCQRRIFVGRSRQAYIVVGEDKMLPETSWTSVLIVQPSTISLDCFAEDGPLNTTDQSSPLPLISTTSCRSCLTRNDLMIDPYDYFFASCHPFIPVSPYEWSTITLFLKEFDPIMEFSHTFGNILGHLWYSQIAGSQSTSVKEFLKPSIGECAEQAGPDLFSGQSTQNLQFALAVNEVFNLWSIDAQKKFPVPVSRNSVQYVFMSYSGIFFDAAVALFVPSAFV